MLTLSLVVLTSAVAQLTMAANPTTAPIAIDVALRDGGVLVGRVVNADGVGQPGARFRSDMKTRFWLRPRPVPRAILPSRDFTAASTRSRPRMGMAFIAFRRRAPQPPAAQPVAALIEGDYVVRGQAEGGPCDPHPVMNFLPGPCGRRCRCRRRGYGRFPAHRFDRETRRSIQPVIGNPGSSGFRCEVVILSAAKDLRCP